MKRLFAFDMDGTLLDSNHKVLPSSIKAIKRIIDVDDIAIICTGRPTTIATRLANEAGIFEMLTANGSIYVNTNTGKTLFNTYFEFDKLSKLIKEVTKFDAYSVIAICEEDLFVYGDSIISWLDEARETFDKSKLIEFDNKNLDGFLNALKENGKVLKVEITPTNLEKTEASIESLMIKVDMNMFTWFLKPNMCGEIVPLGITKWAGIEKYVSHFGIDKNEVYTFGDDLNDFEMIEGATHGIAMGNAVDKIKNAAHYVTDDNNSDGIAKVINMVYDGIKF